MIRKINIAVFISGAGSNARNIIAYFRDNDKVEVSLILSNKSDSGASQISQDTGVPYYIFDRTEFYDSEKVLDVLKSQNVQMIILAGFLWLIPEYLLKFFPNRIINIHPSLLPKYGGKGMYGMKVHKAVKDSGDKLSGITIHLVNEEYDKGQILLQKTVDLSPEDTPEQIAHKIHDLEYAHFPHTIEKYLNSHFQ
ncbi:MAG: phosphoribosylglycinamide formyltransferase [Chitinophagales bacterium]|nr:phosphoribosylglycinamide formyltransferase [Chitinophagales bacterium]MCZ2393442.1 phosphoribosylglycinamide formyltransferase [Chitinophagales bacterium]